MSPAQRRVYAWCDAMGPDLSARVLEALPTTAAPPYDGTDTRLAWLCMRAAVVFYLRPCYKLENTE